MKTVGAAAATMNSEKQIDDTLYSFNLTLQCLLQVRRAARNFQLLRPIRQYTRDLVRFEPTAPE